VNAFCGALDTDVFLAASDLNGQANHPGKPTSSAREASAPCAWEAPKLINCAFMWLAENANGCDRHSDRFMAGVCAACPLRGSAKQSVP
jgi:hypothetical protein